MFVSEPPQKMLLLALHSQNQAAIDERLATEGVKDWINSQVFPGQLPNSTTRFRHSKSMTCLTFASLVNDVANVRQLVEAGADIGITDLDGFSALHYACASDVDSDAKVAYLMQRDASSQAATDDSEQVVHAPEFYSKALQLAASFNQAGRVRALIDDHGASLSTTNQDGHTPFQLAANASSDEAVRVLLSYPNCDFGIKEKSGAGEAALLGGFSFYHHTSVLIRQKYGGTPVFLQNIYDHA